MFKERYTKMSTDPEISDDVSQEKGQTLEANSDLRLLETFNHALSSIIRDPKESCSSSSSPKHAPSPKRRRPLIWFPDEDVKLSGNSMKPKPESTGEIANQSIKQEDTRDPFDEYHEWIDGSVKRRYSLTSREAQSHSSGWAMKYTNNHNKYVLKKTCVGVLLCSENCRSKDDTRIKIRPAISDKVRERQIGQQCPNPQCKNGRIVHRKCTGNNGYPVTHFWVHHMNCVQFESKGHHDHPKPEAKRTSIRKRESTKYNIDENMVSPGIYTNQQSCLPYLRPEDLKNFARYLDYRGDYVRSCDVTDGNEHVSIATAPMRELARDIFSEKNNNTNFSKVYVLCRTLPSYVPGFDLLESRLLSCATPECPLVLVTLYRSGGIDGILEHIKHLTVLCSSTLQKISVPKWHYLIHDFSRDIQTLAVETVVNLMVDTQMQTLLNEFQYKSVSSLYKMLRQRMSGTLRSFEEHYRICRYELMLRIEDPRLLTSVEDLLARVQSRCCTAKEYLNIDVLVKDGMLGSQVREFWQFWGSDIMSSAVFPAAKIIHDPAFSRHHDCSVPETCNHVTNVRIQDAFMFVVEWLQKRGTIYPSCNAWTHICSSSTRNAAGLNPRRHCLGQFHSTLPLLPSSYLKFK